MNINATDKIAAVIDSQDATSDRARGGAPTPERRRMGCGHCQEQMISRSFCRLPASCVSKRATLALRSFRVVLWR
jgi:hypothetical protein